jgi:hypothetical protein
LAAAIALGHPESGYRAGERVEITNLNQLVITLIESGNEKEIKVSGDINISWINDSESLAAELAGKSQQDFKNVINNYRGVVSVQTKFFPFWKKDFPENTKKIIINQR